MNPMLSRIWLRALNGALFVFFSASLMSAGEIEVPFEPMPPSSPEVKKLMSIAESGALDKAAAEAQKLTTKQPDNLDAWMFLGLMQSESGEYEKALAAFEKGIRKMDADLPFLLMMARVHEDRGRLGLGGARIRGGVRYTKVPDDINEEAFKAEQFRAAAKCFERALEIRPGVKPYQQKRAVLLLSAGDVRSAYDGAKAYVKVNPDDAVLWLQVARAAQLLGKDDDAREAAERCLTLNNSAAAAYAIMADLCEKKGDGNEANLWRQKQRFYAAVPDFFAGPYCDESYALMKTIIEKEYEPENLDLPGVRTYTRDWMKRAESSIDGLIAKKSNVSSQSLASIALSHEWHGEVENRIFAELEARKDEALLVLLLKKAQSACTIGGCAPALARLKSDAAFPLIIDLLPNDRGMFSMRIPEALAIYERPEAAAALTAALGEAIKRNKGVRQSPENFMSGFGEAMFLERCIWALKGYNTPEVQAVLKKAAKEGLCKTGACAVLFLQTRDKAYYKQLMGHLKKQPGDAEGIAYAFRKAGLPENAEIEKIAQAEKEKREREKQEQAKRSKGKK